MLQLRRMSNSFLPLSLHRNIRRRANVSLEQSLGENMHACPFTHTDVRKRTPGTQTKRVLGGINVTIH